MSLSETFTQGGQTQLHKLRMIRQVIGTTLVASLLLGIFVFILRCFMGFNLYFLYMVRSFYWAEIKINLQFLPNQKLPSQFFTFPNGQTLELYCRDILKLPELQQAVSLFWEKGESYSFFALECAIASFIMISVFWIVKGRQRRIKRLIQGSKVLEEKEFTVFTQKISDKSGIKIDSFTLPKGAETKHIMTLGTTGSGKTNCLNHLLSQIRNRNQKAIILDTTGDFVSRYYNPETDILLNPFDERSQNWSFWSDCEFSFHYDALAAAFIPNKLKDDFWTTGARTLFSVAAQKLSSKRDLKELLDVLLKKPQKQLQSFFQGTSAAALVETRAEQMVGSIRAVLNANIKSLFLLETKGPFFSVRKWIQEEKGRGEKSQEEADKDQEQDENKEIQKGWLFLTCTPEQRDTLRPLLSAWVSIASTALMGCPPSPDRRVWFILDELASLNQLESLPTALAEFRKYGGCVVAGLQDIHQIESRYGREEGKAMLGLFNTKIVFRLNDYDTAKRVSDSFGEQETSEMIEGISFGAHQMRDGVSLSDQRKYRPVISPTDLMKLENLEAYIKIAENGALGKTKFSYRAIPSAQPAFCAKSIEFAIDVFPLQDNLEEKPKESSLTFEGPIVKVMFQL
ncbi:MAG: type IV secretion system DNA-binding domain-containing protein [Alphaproteobacteria bacterium]|nr:type IV secretion system DNA-binding domain-containing protein [Alphaproteobacteria bacterium]